MPVAHGITSKKWWEEKGAEMVAGRRAKNTPVLHGTHPIRWRQPELVLKRRKIRPCFCFCSNFNVAIGSFAGNLRVFQQRSAVRLLLLGIPEQSFDSDRLRFQH
jgi:hypothetical protein